MAEHKHGSMDISAQVAAFNGFLKWAAGVAIFSICVLIFMGLVNA